jgi:hypothetical protein
MRPPPTGRGFRVKVITFQYCPALKAGLFRRREGFLNEMANKKSTELIELDGFFWGKGLMRRKEFFSILDDNYTPSTLKKD